MVIFVTAEPPVCLVSFMTAVRYLLACLLTLQTCYSSPVDPDLSEFKDDMPPVSSLTCSSLGTSKFIHFNDEHYRPRGSSFHNHGHSAPKHVSFGWVQFSDDRWMPSEDMEDTEENRQHILIMMLTDARHGNLEYFNYLAGILQLFKSRNPGSPETIAFGSHELDFYNANSLIFAAIHSDNVELFCEVMKFTGITFDDLRNYDNEESVVLFDNDSDDEDEFRTVEETVLGQAVIQNSISIVTFLLENGVRDIFPENSNTALHLAILHGHELLVRVLLEQGGSLIEKRNGAFMTPLMVAIECDNDRIVKLLITMGASVAETDLHQRNCLHYAAKQGNLSILKLLNEVVSSRPYRNKTNWPWQMQRISKEMSHWIFRKINSCFNTFPIIFIHEIKLTFLIFIDNVTWTTERFGGWTCERFF